MSHTSSSDVHPENSRTVCQDREENWPREDLIYSSSLVNATTTHDSGTEQFIDCLTRLVSTDFNHKSWNKSTEFALFLKPEVNMAKALRKERFNIGLYT